MTVMWSTIERGRRHKAALSPELELDVYRLCEPRRPSGNYSVRVFSTTFCMNFDSDDEAKTFAVNQARKTLTTAVSKLGDAA